MSIFSQDRALWIWQFDQLGEKSMAEIARTAITYAWCGIVLVKTMDGQSWMGQGVDTSPLAITDLAAWEARVSEGEAAGLIVLPWVVPTFASDANAHAQFGKKIILDLEPKEIVNGRPYFWQDSAANIPHYLEGLRAAGVTEIYASIDARAPQMATLDVPNWLHLVDGVLPQVYWTDFQQPASVVVPILESLTPFGVEVIPALPYNGTEEDLRLVWGASVGLCGSSGATLWRMGTADAAQLSAFGRLPLPVAEDCAEVTAERDTYRQALSDIQARVVAAFGPASG